MNGRSELSEAEHLKIYRQTSSIYRKFKEASNQINNYTRAFPAELDKAESFSALINLLDTHSKNMLRSSENEKWFLSGMYFVGGIFSNSYNHGYYYLKLRQDLYRYAREHNCVIKQPEHEPDYKINTNVSKNL